MKMSRVTTAVILTSSIYGFTLWPASAHTVGPFSQITVQCPVLESGTIIGFKVNGREKGQILFDVLASDTLQERIFLDNKMLYNNIIKLGTTDFRIGIPSDIDDLTSTQRQVLGATPTLLSSTVIRDRLFNCVKKDVTKMISQTPSAQIKRLPEWGGNNDLCELGCDVSEVLIDVAIFFGVTACCTATAGAGCVVCGSAGIVGSKANDSLNEKCTAGC